MALDLNHTARVDSQRVYTPQVEVDCSEITVPSDGKVKAMTIPAGFLVKEVRTQVLTAEGSALDIDVGDSSTVNQFGDALDGNDDSVDNLDTSGGSDTPYTSEDYIQVMFKDNGADTANQPSTVKVRVTARFVDLGAQ
jgi:hypothetical protein